MIKTLLKWILIIIALFYILAKTSISIFTIIGIGFIILIGVVAYTAWEGMEEKDPIKVILYGGGALLAILWLFGH